MTRLACALLLAGAALLPIDGTNAGHGNRHGAVRRRATDCRRRPAAIENSAFLVEGARITQVGRAARCAGQPASTVVDLQGKTVIPALVDAHSHLGYTDARTGDTSSTHYTRENLLDHLRRYAYYGIAATLSMGLDRGELPYELRAMPADGAALFLTAGRGIAMPNAGPNALYWRDAPVRRHDRERGAAGCPRAGGEESRLREDLGGRQEQDRHAAAAVALSPDHRGSARARAPRRRTRVLPCRREGAVARRHRRVRARDPRSRSGRRDHGVCSRRGRRCS